MFLGLRVPVVSPQLPGFLPLPVDDALLVVLIVVVASLASPCEEPPGLVVALAWYRLGIWHRPLSSQSIVPFSSQGRPFPSHTQ